MGAYNPTLPLFCFSSIVVFSGNGACAILGCGLTDDQMVFCFVFFCS